MEAVRLAKGGPTMETRSDVCRSYADSGQGAAADRGARQSSAASARTIASPAVEPVPEFAELVRALGDLKPCPVTATQGMRRGPPEPLTPVMAGLREQMRALDLKAAQKPVMNRLVYDSQDPSPFYVPRGTHDPDDPKSDAHWAPRCEAVNPEALAAGTLPPWYVAHAKDPTVVFEARFESGNLRRAIQVGEFEYDLILRPDYGSDNHVQWFFFGASNLRAGQPYKFNIVNFTKDSSLYNEGLLPALFSVQQHRQTGRGWYRAGVDVCYYTNEIPRKGAKKAYSTLTTTIVPHLANDTIYIAGSVPFTYSDCVRHLDSLEADTYRRRHTTRECMCYTIAGRRCEALTITDRSGEEDLQHHPAQGLPMSKRRGVILTARVHPGECNASWVMKGALDFLTGPSAEADLLRRHFVFRVVPMLNPDGVYYGNYRCSLAGCDLNRQWQSPSERDHPEVYFTKMSMLRMLSDQGIEMFVDFHGHSRKKGVFIYGCTDPQPTGGEPSGCEGFPYCVDMLGPGCIGCKIGVPISLQQKLYPYILEREAPEIFSFGSSVFSLHRSKETTARAVGYRELGLCNSFTLEASFAGPASGPHANTHLTTSQLERLGAAVGSALLVYTMPQTHDHHVSVIKDLIEAVSRPKEAADGGASAAPPPRAQQDDAAEPDPAESNVSSRSNSRTSLVAMDRPGAGNSGHGRPSKGASKGSLSRKPSKLGAPARGRSRKGVSAPSSKPAGGKPSKSRSKKQAPPDSAAAVIAGMASSPVVKKASVSEEADLNLLRALAEAQKGSGRESSETSRERGAQAGSALEDAELYARYAMPRSVYSFMSRDIWQAALRDPGAAAGADEGAGPARENAAAEGEGASCGSPAPAQGSHSSRTSSALCAEIENLSVAAASRGSSPVPGDIRARGRSLSVGSKIPTITVSQPAMASRLFRSSGRHSNGQIGV
ncbi:unnamed protein product [Pedinophyceae sp. YPF-701]|nr:unnamed protein product [Pedinophyceae sp. YPF-701]